MMQSFAICCLVTILWIVVGYSLAFGDGGNLNAYIGGLDRIAARRARHRTTLSKTIPETVFMIFQMTFAIITPALITGAFADRMKFSAMLLFIGPVVAPRLRAGRATGSGAAASSAPTARSTSPAARSSTSTPASPAWSPHRARQAARLRHREHGAAQPGPEP